MIDDYAQAMELVRKMTAHLPIPARPTKTFIQAMRDSEIKVRSEQNLQIDKRQPISGSGIGEMMYRL